MNIGQIRREEEKFEEIKKWNEQGFEGIQHILDKMQEYSKEYNYPGKFDMKGTEEGGAWKVEFSVELYDSER